MYIFDNFKHKSQAIFFMEVIKPQLSPLMFVLLILMCSLQMFVFCYENQIVTADFQNFTYSCDGTDMQQFQGNIANAKAITVTFQSCIESCLSVPGYLFTQATGLQKLRLVFNQGEQDYADVCSTTRFALDNTTFAGLSMLEVLYMEGFEKTVVDPGVFQPLRNLQTLSLVRFGAERLPYKNLSVALAALSGTPLQHLELNGIISKYSDDNQPEIGILFQIKNVSITTLAFENNIVPNVIGRLSEALPYLKKASFSLQIRYAPAVLFIADAITSLNDLEELKIYTYPPDVVSSVDYNKFNLRKLPEDLQSKLFEEPDSSCFWNNRAPLSPKLRMLELRGLKFLIAQTQWSKLCFQKENVLEKLDVSDSPLPSNLALADGLANLTELHAKRCQIKYITSDQLLYTPALKILDVAENNLNQLFSGSFVHVPGGQSLEVFNLSQCQLQSIPVNQTSNFTSIQLLDMSQNYLKSVDLLLENCGNLSLLNLSGNRIESMSSFAMEQLQNAALKSENLTIDIRGNPLSCLCNATDFVKWMQLMGPSHFIGYSDQLCRIPDGNLTLISEVDLASIRTDCAVLAHVEKDAACPCDRETLFSLSNIRASLIEYNCKNANGKLVDMSTLDPDETLKLCSLKPSVFTSAAFLVPLILGTALITVVGIVLIWAYVMKKKRHLDYYPIKECLDPNYIIGHLMALVYKNKETTKEFLYDAFVCFHDGDVSLIRQPILNRLESHVQITTPEHFELGAAIYAEIERSVKNSRWIVFLMTQAFVDDNWCRETVLRSIPRQHAIIPVIMNSLDLGDNEVYTSLLNTNSPITWPEVYDLQDKVFNTLLDKIKSDHSANV